jgi:glutaminyl-peptide cyclotransferase
VTARLMATVCAAMMVSACGDPPPPDVTFDGARALEYVRLQVDAGPRIPGTEPHRLVGDRIVAELRKTADTVMEQAWTHVTQKGDTLPMRNIFAQFNRAAARRILYLAHWDSRPKADKSFAEADRAKPVPGANDGASGVALLLVLAEALKAAPSGVGVDFLFTDG